MDNEKRVQAARRLAEIEGLMAHFDSVLSSEKKELEKLLAEADEEKLAPLTFSQFADSHNWSVITDRSIIKNFIRGRYIPSAEYNVVHAYYDKESGRTDVMFGVLPNDELWLFNNGILVKTRSQYVAKLILFNVFKGRNADREKRIQWISKLLEFRDTAETISEIWPDDFTGETDYPFDSSFCDIARGIREWVRHQLDTLT